MARSEIRISGFGGQGVILAAYVIGKAAAVVEGRHATLNQSFGPEARGSACSAQLIVSDDPVMFPYVRRTDVLVTMSQEAYRLFKGETAEGGMILYDDSLVTPELHLGRELVGVPATRIAEELGRRVVSNMVVVGLFVEATKLVLPESARKAIESSVPAGTEELNLRAFERGIEGAREAMLAVGAQGEPR
jgi:2-oxoglutarate ferredoxin oxidoreductase subunit gamma